MADILIIDDDLTFVGDLASIISADGHKCFYYESVDEVLDNFGKISMVDKIILDLMMMKRVLLKPNENESKFESGEILFHRISKTFPGKPIIVLTAKNEGDIKINRHKYPNLKVITKPLNENKIDHLLSML